jgi:hypothetical protein
VLVEQLSGDALTDRVKTLATPEFAGEFDLACAAYLLDVAVQDETTQLEERSPFPQVDWLRRARLELAHWITARLNTSKSSAA